MRRNRDPHAGDLAGRQIQPSGAPSARSAPEGRGRGLPAPEHLGNRAALAMWRSGALQRKPRVSEPGDASERDADRCADAVVRPAPAAASTLAPHAMAAGTFVHSAAPDRDIVPAAPAGAAGAEPPAVWGSGSPLPGGVLDLMESRFGRSFDQVRVHTGEAADAAADAVAARAFTAGNDIVFGAGQFAPGSTEGQRLIAHELAHVLQQSGAGGETSAAVVSEAEATAAGRAVTEGRTPEINTRASPGSIQREPLPVGVHELPVGVSWNTGDMTELVVGQTTVFAVLGSRLNDGISGKAWEADDQPGILFLKPVYPSGKEAFVTKQSHWKQVRVVDGPPAPKPPPKVAPLPRPRSTPRPQPQPQADAALVEPNAAKDTPQAGAAPIADRMAATLQAQDLAGAAELAPQMSDVDLAAMTPTDRALLLWSLALNPKHSTLDVDTAARVLNKTPDDQITALEDQLFAQDGLLLKAMTDKVKDNDQAKKLIESLMGVWKRGEFPAGPDDGKPRWMKGLTGEPIKRTRGQYDQMLKDAPVILGRKIDTLQTEITLDDRNRAWRNHSIGDLVDMWGGATKPPTATEMRYGPQWWYRNPYATADYARRLLNDGRPFEAGEQWRTGAAMNQELFQDWQRYQSGHVDHGDDLIKKLEMVRNGSFGIAAGLGGAVAAPLVFGWVTAAGGGTLLAGGTAIGGGALAGGGIHGGLEFGATSTGELLINDKANWNEVGSRTWQGTKSGLGEGALGSAGYFSSAALAARLGPTAAGSLGGRLFIGGSVGTGSGFVTSSVDTALHPDQTPAWQRILGGTALGGLTGTAFSAVPINGIYRSGGQTYNPFSGTPTTPRWALSSPWSTLQNGWNPPAGFHSLPEGQLPPVPQAYAWGRVNGEWVPMRPPSAEQPLQLGVYGPDAAGRVDYNLLANGRLLGSSAFTRAAPTYGQTGGQRSEMPFGAADFVEPTTGNPNVVGHNVDFADTKGLPGAAGNSNADPLNYTPEAVWWGLRVRSPLVGRIRTAGGGYRQMNYYDGPPRATASGVPIPDGVYFVETNPAGEAVNAWQIPFDAHPYNFSPGKGNAASTLLPFQVPQTQLPPVLQAPLPNLFGGSAGVLIVWPEPDKK